MKWFLISRAGMSLVAIVLAAAFIFALIHLSPTDPTALALGGDSSAEQRQALSHQLGLDRPVLEQFGSWAGGAVRGDLGTSIFTHQPVGSSIVQRLPVTASLCGGAVLLALVLGLLLGFFGGLRPDSWADRIVTSGVSVGLAVPGFWLALLLALAFAVKLRIFPVAGYTSLADDPLQWARGLVLPCVALSLHAAAVIARQMRGAVIEVMEAPFMEAVRARGTPRRTMVRRYALKNALVPVLPIIGIEIAVTVATSVVMERVFAMQGVGTLLVDAVVQSDFPVVEGTVLAVAVLVIVINFLVDVGLAVVDPRVHPQ